MDSVEIKNKLIERIKSIQDLELLTALLDVLNNKPSKNTYNLNDSQLQMVKEVEEQIKSDNYTEHDSLFNEIDEWLKKK